MKRIITFLVLLFGVLSTLIAGTPVDMYLTGDFNGWKFESKYQFSKVGDNNYEIDLGKSPLLMKPGMDFKILSSDYDTYDYGTTSVSDCGTSYTLVKDKGANCEVQSLILFSKVSFSTLTNEMILHCANDGEYSQTATLYIGAPCYYDSESIGFGAFATEADFNKGEGVPYAIVKAQKVPSMYIHGYQVYKAEIPFDERVYVASMEYSSFNYVCKEFTEEGAWYCGSPFPGIGGCYRSFDEARFRVDLIDLNFKPEANTLYVIGSTPRLTVYSSEYGIEQGKEISYEGILGYTLKGKKIYYYPVTNVDIFDMVRYYGEDMAIDWNKPFFYEGERYASLNDVPVDEIKETSCWKLWGFNATDYGNGMVLSHVGNNVYKETYEYLTIVPKDAALDITLANHANNTSGACVRQIKAIATPEQTGRYNITFTYDANTQDLTHEWELVSADAISVESSDIKGYFNGTSYLNNLDAKMELVGVNEYKYTCKVEMEKGLKYYTIVDDYSGFTAKDILFQIPETGLYEFTFTYNAATQKYACDVKKSYDFDPIYFRGTVNEWGVDEKYKLTTTDGDYYVATYAAGKEVELGDPEGGIAKFKIGSGNDIWRPINFGYSNKSQYKYLTAGTPCILASGGSDVSIVGSLKASKIEFTKSTGTLLVTAAQAESEYTTVYVVNEKRFQNIYAFARPINSTDYDDVEVEKLPKTYQGYEVYSYTFKSIYDQLMINGTGGNSINYFTVNKVKPYYYGGVWYETLDMEDAKPTYIYLVNTSGMDLEKITKYYSNLDRTGQVKQPVLISEKVAGYDVYRFEVDAVATGIVWYTPDYSPEIGYPFDVDESQKLTPYYANGVWYESLDDIKIDPKPEGPTVFDITTDQGVAFVVNPNSANPVFVPLIHSYNVEFQTAQYTGTYTVTDLDFTAKIGGLTNLDVINYGTNGQALAPNYVYDPTRGASNGFRIVVGDYEVGDILNINATFDSYWNVTLIIDVTKILEPTPNDITLYYVNSNEWDTVNGYIWPTGGTGILEWPGAPATKIDKTVDGYDVYSYTFDSTKADNIIFNAGLGGAQTKDLAVNASKPYFYNGVWYETLTFDAAGGDEGGNEGGDQGGDEGGDQGGEEGGDDTDPIVPETSAYVVRGNGGSDATGIWCGGIEWTNDDSPVNNMTDADKDGIYEVTYKNVPAGTWNFKVVGVTEGWMGSDYLDTENSSAGYTTAPYDGNIGFTLNAPADVTIKFNTLTGKIIVTTPSGSFGKVKIDHFHITIGSEDVCLDQYEFTEANNYTLTFTENFVVDPDYGYSYAYYRIIGNCNYAVYEKNFGIDVTVSGTYTVTIQFNGDYENPDFTIEAVKQGGSDEPEDPNPVYPEIWLIGQVTGYQFLDEWKFNSTDGDNYVIEFTTPKELTSLFRIAGNGPIMENPSGEPIYSFSVEARTNIEANTAYTLLPHGGDNIGVEGIIEATRIEFQLSTGTFKVIGTSKAKVFDLTKDYNLCVNFDPAYPMTFKGNGVYTGTYVFPADANGYKRSFVFGDVNDAVVAMGPTFAENGLAPLAYNTPIPLTTTYNALLSEHLCYGGDTFEFTLTFKSDWTASVVVSYIPNLEGRTYTVNGNGGSDATGIWCGGIEWSNGDSPANNMTDADADGIYEVTYKNVPAGTWSFKVVALINAVQYWIGSDFLDTKNSSAGCTTAPYDGNIGFTLNAPADVTIKFNALTGKIIVTTPSGSFGKVKIDHFHITTGSEDVCLDQYEFTEANNYTLTFTENIVVNPEYGYGYAYYRIIGNCSYAVYEKNFGVDVTVSGTYTVTIQFNGDYENPDFTITAVKQGGSDEPEDPDNPDTPVVPDPVISDITVPTFPQIEVGETSTATVTYTLENATSATVSIESEGEEAFFIQSQSVVKGEGSVSIMFMPETKGVHAATLVIKSGKVTETLRILAKAVDPAPEVLPVISNINVPAFADTYINATNVVTATYSLANATEATATISGANADAFYILSQSVGSVKILFMPEAKGTYNAILTITSGKTTESVNLTAKAIEFIPEPEPAISNVNVPAFATIEIGNAANVTATFSLENATEVSATLSGTGADAFILGQPMVNNGNGSIKIAFVPESAGTYTATLTLKSGKAVHTATITAVATEPAPQVRIENIQVPVFEEVYLGGYTSVNVTYTLVNATKATVTVTGDVFSTGSNVVVGGKGTVPVDFMPETAGVHTATLTITAGGVSESVTLVAIAKLKSTDEPSGKVTISNIQVPEFASITAKETTTVTASYVLTGATSANASLSGTDAAYFTILSQTLSEGVGQVEIKFAPTVAREYNATLVVTSGSVTESIDFSATASEAPSISALHVNDFGTVYVGEKVTVMANYSLAYAETATATLSGDTDVFAISRQMVSDGNGVVRIDFTPNAVGTYHATLTIKSGVSEESISFSATAIKYEEPEIEPVISNLIVPEFGEVLIGETVQKIATYTLENATEATATLSGDAAFTITRTLNGAVRIMFAPTAAGTYNGTLTITSGKVSESISFSATAIKDVEPEIEPVISNLIIPDFGEVLIGETVQRIATYTLENATEATATLSGDDAFTITRTLNGAVRIMFAPTQAGTYSATLTITSGKVSESITFSAKAVEEGGEEPGPGPEDPVEPEKPDPLPEYPVRGYLYVVNTPDERLEEMVKYRPISVDTIDYFLAPEKIETKIYGYDIYKFEVRDEEMIDLWEYSNARYTDWHIDVNVDLSATPYLANGVWYSSIEEMMTWYVRYIPNWDDEALEVMVEESPGVYVATFDAFAESDDNDKYYYFLGNVEDPILEVGVDENYLQIPQGFKAMIYLDDTNWETEWKTYYKLVPPGKDWDRDCIDLGLTSGLCWATKNLGATEPQQEGTHFAWGEVEPKEEYSYKTYKWANQLKNNEYFKYVTDDYWGTIVDFRTTLEPEDDAANVAMSSEWHIPTQADVEELLRECTTEFGSYYGVNGYFVTGPNGNAIFLPAVGIKEGTDYEESTRGGDYWTSSLYEDNQKYAVTLSFSLAYIDIDDMQRTNGLAIRPVIHRDYVGIEEVVAINVYAKDHTIYCEEPFQIYTVTGLDVTHLNGALEGVYIVKTEKGNQLISVW